MPNNGGYIGITKSIEDEEPDGIWSMDDVHLRQTNYVPLAGNGQELFTTPGIHTFTVPAGVTSICVVVVGGGGAGAPYFGMGGAGGGLAYKNNITVTPGANCTITVGAGGVSNTINVFSTTADSGTIASGNGEDSSFTDGSITVTATGGEHGAGLSSARTSPVGGGPSGTYDGGGTGGTCLGRYSSDDLGDQSYTSSGGGGAGGYTGDGGDGAGAPSGSYSEATDGINDAGGGGAGMSVATRSGYAWGGAGGGGVDVYGAGSAGAGGTFDPTSSSPDSSMRGEPGSGGSYGGLPQVDSTGGEGGAWGGAGGSGNGSSSFSKGGNGAQGAVRIIWGAGRAFPSTNTADV
jgi:hypothetical protein